MQIFATEQIKAWDEFTIRKEPIASIDLMERAAASCFDWLMQNGYDGKNFSIFCGKGNNGQQFGHMGTEDFQTKIARLQKTNAVIKFVSTEDTIYPIAKDDVVIDAL